MTYKNLKKLQTYARNEHKCYFHKCLALKICFSVYITHLKVFSRNCSEIYLH